MEDLADNPHMDRSHSECVDTYIHLVLDCAVRGLVVGVVRILGTVVLIGHLQLVAQIAPETPIAVVDVRFTPENNEVSSSTWWSSPFSIRLAP